MKKLLFILCALLVSSAHADVLDACLEKIEQNNTNSWHDILFTNSNAIFNFLTDNDELTDDIVQKNKQKIYTMLAENILEACPDKLLDITKIPRGNIRFTRQDKKYRINFSTETLFDYSNIRVGFLIINKKNLEPGNILKLSDIPEKEKFFTDECSDHVIWDITDNKAAVNVAGQSVFTEFGGNKNEFILDFAEGDNRRAFPGLVLMEKTHSVQEQIVTYSNVKTATEKMELFGSKLRKSACSNQGLALYLVALDVKQDISEKLTIWGLIKRSRYGYGAIVGPREIDKDLKQVMILSTPYML